MTGDVILSIESGSWENFFKLTEGVEVPEDFMTDHVSEPPQKGIFFEWTTYTQKGYNSG